MRLKLWSAAVLLLLAGCASGGAHLDQLSADALFQRGMSAYQQHDWSKAIAAFDRLTTQYPNYTRVAEARYRLADSYFGDGEYVTAASEFDRLSSDFPAGPWADDARFKVCQSYANLSPGPALDQQYTRSAIGHCQSLLTYYPSSKYAPRAKEIIADLTGKLAQKLYEAGDFYYRRHAYDSSLIYFQDVVKQYPSTPAASESLLHMVQAYQQIGDVDSAKSAKARLLKDYPKSAAAREVSGISLAST